MISWAPECQLIVVFYGIAAQIVVKLGENDWCSCLSPLPWCSESSKTQLTCRYRRWSHAFVVPIKIIVKLFIAQVKVLFVLRVKLGVKASRLVNYKTLTWVKYWGPVIYVAAYTVSTWVVKGEFAMSINNCASKQDFPWLSLMQEAAISFILMLEQGDVNCQSLVNCNRTSLWQLHCLSVVWVE